MQFIEHVKSTRESPAPLPPMPCRAAPIPRPATPAKPMSSLVASNCAYQVALKPNPRPPPPSPRPPPPYSAHQEECRSPWTRCWSTPSQHGVPVKELGDCLQTRCPPPHLDRRLHGCSRVPGTTNQQQIHGEGGDRIVVA
jgi:hypothetical protein